MAASSLPESFLQAATLHIGGADWSVQKAEPPLSSQYVESGKLVLTLSKIERLGSRTILYSLPTINDALPAASGQADNTEAVLREDDWRQVEFVHSSYRQIVEQELQDIRKIYAEHRQGIGFTKIHVRSRLPDALSVAKLEMQVLHRLLPGPSRSIRFDGYGDRIANGFAYELSGNWLLYGVAVTSFIQILALHTNDARSPIPQMDTIDKLIHEHGLLLADWCRCSVSEP